MNILVIDPSGPVAEQILRELIAPEFSIRILTTQPSALPGEIADAAEVIEGSTTQLPAWELVLENIDAVLWCESDAAWMTADAAEFFERAGVRHVVTLGLLADSSWHTQIEELFAHKAVPARHLRFGTLLDHLLLQRENITKRAFFALPVPEENTIPWSAMPEVVDAALRWLIRCNWDGIEAIQMAAEPLSGSELAEMFSDVLDSPLRFRSVNPAEFTQRRSGHGLRQDRVAAMMREWVQVRAEMMPGIEWQWSTHDVRRWLEIHFVTALQCSSSATTVEFERLNSCSI